jgi:hypothetical protein
MPRKIFHDKEGECEEFSGVQSVIGLLILLAVDCLLIWIVWHYVKIHGWM